MPEIDGFDVARHLADPRPLIIFQDGVSRSRAGSVRSRRARLCCQARSQAAAGTCESSAHDRDWRRDQPPIHGMPIARPAGQRRGLSAVAAGQAARQARIGASIDGRARHHWSAADGRRLRAHRRRISDHRLHAGRSRGAAGIPLSPRQPRGSRQCRARVRITSNGDGSATIEVTGGATIQSAVGALGECGARSNAE